MGTFPTQLWLPAYTELAGVMEAPGRGRRAVGGSYIADALDRILARDCGLDIVEIPRCQHLQAPRERQRTC